MSPFLDEQVGGRFLDRGGAFVNVLHPHFGAVFNERGEVVNGSEVIQAAWDETKETGGRVYLPNGFYNLSLSGNASRGYGPALDLDSTGNKERTPLLEGESRGVTLQVAFPPDAPRDQEVIRISASHTDNQRGMGLRNFRLVNTNEPRGGDFRMAVDHRGCGIRITNSWTGPLLDNFQIRGFCTGINYDNGYFSKISNGEIRNCNFGLDFQGDGTANGNMFECLVFRTIQKVSTVPDWMAARADRWPEGIVGAAINGMGGQVSACTFIGCGAEQCGSVGIYLGGGTPVAWTFIGWRNELVQVPVYIRGPLPPHLTAGHTFVSPFFSAGALEGPVVYGLEAEATFISPYFHEVPDDRLAFHLASPRTKFRIMQPSFNRPHASGDNRRWLRDDSQASVVAW